MCISRTNRKRCKTSPFKRGYKLFAIHKGKIYTNYAGKEIKLGDKFLNGKTTKAQEKKLSESACVKSYCGSNGVLFDRIHIGKISVYLDFRSVYHRLGDKNFLIAHVGLEQNDTTIIGTMNYQSIALTRKIRIFGYVKGLNEDGDLRYYNEFELKELLEESKEKK